MTITSATSTARPTSPAQHGASIKTYVLWGVALGFLAGILFGAGFSQEASTPYLYGSPGETIPNVGRAWLMVGGMALAAVASMLILIAVIAQGIRVATRNAAR